MDLNYATSGQEGLDLSAYSSYIKLFDAFRRAWNDSIGLGTVFQVHGDASKAVA